MNANKSRLRQSHFYNLNQRKELGLALSLLPSQRTLSSSSKNNNNKINHRPMVHLSSAPNVKFTGCKIGSSHPIIPHTISPKRQIPQNILSTLSKCNSVPSYAMNGVSTTFGSFPSLDNYHHHDKKSMEIQKIRKACQLASKMLQKACQLAQQPEFSLPSSSSFKATFHTTDYIDQIIHNDLIYNHNAYPSPLNYNHYPKSICTSINEVICHGIPDSRRLMYGDLVSIDVSVYMDGVHGDNCYSFIVGHNSEDERSEQKDLENDVDDEVMEQKYRARQLIYATKKAMYEAIDICRQGTTLNHIGNIIHDVADHYGYRPMKQVCGHGIGVELHMSPQIKVRISIKH